MALQRRRSHLDFVLFLAIRWPEHLPGHADSVDVALCDTVVLDGLPDLFLDIHPRSLCRPVPFQSSSVLVLRFHRRLPVSRLVRAIDRLTHRT